MKETKTKQNPVAELSGFCYTYLIKSLASLPPSLVKRYASKIFLWVSSATTSCRTILSSSICGFLSNSLTALTQIVCGLKRSGYPVRRYNVEVSPWTNLTNKEKRVMLSPQWTRYRKDKCEECGAVNNFQVGNYTVKRKILTIHHIDGDIENNDPSNLQTLCRKCHAKKHNE